MGHTLRDLVQWAGHGLVRDGAFGPQGATCRDSLGSRPGAKVEVVVGCSVHMLRVSSGDRGAWPLLLNLGSCT